MSGEPLRERAEAVVAVFRRGEAFTRELVAENERLRDEIESLRLRQDSAARDPQDWEKLRHELLQRIDDLELRNRRMQEQLQAISSESAGVAERFAEIEAENDNLANLYVASYQLHSTLDPAEVMRIITEIIINLVGGERFCIHLYDEREGSLVPVAAEGAPLECFARACPGEGAIGRALAGGEVWLRDAGSAGEPAEDDPLVVIPLRVGERAVGAIAVYALLGHKRSFGARDEALFALLAGQAATAIFASQLYAAAERKLNTIQGFIDLLTR